MSIVNTFDNTSEEILKPTHKSMKIDGFPETIMVLFNQKMVDIILGSNDFEIIGNMHAGVDIPIYKIVYKQKEIAFYLTWLGAPATVSLLEEAIAKGGKKILLFGSCGSLNKDITAGHIIVPTWAYRDEGTSYHYMSASDGDYVEVKSAKHLEEILTELKVPYTCGKTWTTDAFFRETRKNMELRKSDGCLTVEMECASVMAMAQFRGVKAYQFLYSADNLDGEEWDERILGYMPSDIREQLVRIALEVALRL
jgi:uridine phosphorylase